MTHNHDDGHGDHGGHWWRFPPLRDALLAALIAGAAFLLELLGVIGHAQAVPVYVVAIPLGGRHWMREGIEELVRERVVGIDILMIAATAASAALGLWDEAAALVVLYGAAEGLEEYTYARTRTAIRSLVNLAPREARILREDREVMVPAAEIRPGDRFVVRPGEAVVTDGVVDEGRSAVNEAPITGESMPVDKATGDTVFAASINGEGALTVCATKAFADNSISRIIHLVEAAQERKGRAQQWIERFGRRYSPAVLLSALLLWLVPWMLGLDADDWAHRAVVLLVAAAPCALIMSMPMAMASGIGGAGRRGILIKGGAHLEHLGAIRLVAFDKTGTLTLGRPAVTDVIALDDDAARLLAGAAAVERFSQHPLAQAIVAEAERRGITVPRASQFTSQTGAGARASVDWDVWRVGRPDWVVGGGLDATGLRPQVDALQAEGKTVVGVACGAKFVGIIGLRDQLRPGAAQAVAALHRLGVRTVMLTGDNARTARSTAAALGIDHVRAGLKPEDKVDAIIDLQREHGAVLMVGDGVNDAPALAAATCGIAMGVVGTDAAIEAADVALMADDLAKVTEALQRGRKALRVSRQNIAISLAVLIAMIPLAVTGMIGVAVAVLVHETAELLAVANGLRAGTIAASSAPTRTLAYQLSGRS